jgi:hypothetical protein
MQEKTLLVKGRLTGPTSVQLNEPVAGVAPDVEVMIHPSSDAKSNGSEAVSAFVRRLAAGTRAKADIDRQIQTEREGWGDR